MEAMKEAFVKAGLPASVVSFAAACHDLARLALNKQPDPTRAAHTWLGMASGATFRDGPLKEFLAAVAHERVASMKSAGDRGLAQIDIQSRRAPSPAEANSEEGRDQVIDETQAMFVSPSSEHNPVGDGGQMIVDAQLARAPAPAGTASGYGSGPASGDALPLDAAPSPDTERERGGQEQAVNLYRGASPPAYREPSAAQLRAVTVAKARSAQVMSGVYIPGHNGGRDAFDDVKIRYYNMTEKRLARAVGRHSVAYNLVRIAQMRLPANHKQLPVTTTSRDVFSTNEITLMQREAAVFAGHGLISLPEELRSAVAEAVESA